MESQKSKEIEYGKILSAISSSIITAIEHDEEFRYSGMAKDIMTMFAVVGIASLLGKEKIKELSNSMVGFAFNNGWAKKDEEKFEEVIEKLWRKNEKTDNKM